jgi:hypothetical protein
MKAIQIIDPFLLPARRLACVLTVIRGVFVVCNRLGAQGARHARCCSFADDRYLFGGNGDFRYSNEALIIRVASMLQTRYFVVQSTADSIVTGSFGLGCPEGPPAHRQLGFG